VAALRQVLQQDAFPDIVAQQNVNFSGFFGRIPSDPGHSGRPRLELGRIVAISPPLCIEKLLVVKSVLESGLCIGALSGIYGCRNNLLASLQVASEGCDDSDSKQDSSSHHPCGNNEAGRKAAAATSGAETVYIFR